MSEQIGVLIIMLALANAILLWASFRKELYRRLLFLLGVGLGITGIGLVTLAAKIEEQATSISDPKLQGAVNIALIGVVLAAVGFNNIFFAFLKAIENIRRS